MPSHSSSSRIVIFDPLAEQDENDAIASQEPVGMCVSGNLLCVKYAFDEGSLSNSHLADKSVFVHWPPLLAVPRRLGPHLFLSMSLVKHVFLRRISRQGDRDEAKL